MQTQPAGNAVGAGLCPSRAHGVTESAGKFAPMTSSAALADDVLQDILYAGICHSELHTARGDWGAPKLPRVPGHETVGRVVAVGRKVRATNSIYEAGYKSSPTCSGTAGHGVGRNSLVTTPYLVSTGTA